MATITIKEILAKSHLPESMLSNTQVTRRIAQRLMQRGYRRVSRRIDGKMVRVWTNDAGISDDDLTAFVDSAVEDIV